MLRDAMYAEQLLWRKAPEAVEDLTRTALASPRLAASVREELQVALIYALMYQHKFVDAQAVVREVQAMTPSPGAAMCDALLAFYTNEPWPEPWHKLEARW